MRSYLGLAVDPFREARVAALEDLHLPAPIAGALERLGWTVDDPFVREAVPTAARGHNLVLVVPPSPAGAAPVLGAVLGRLSAGHGGLVLAPAGQLDEWGRVAHQVAGQSGLRIQVARGTSRATRRLRDGSIDLLIATPETAIALQRRAALHADGLAAVVLASPETWEDEEAVSPLMQDLKDAQRVVVTAAPERAAGFVERYARRALTVGADSPAAAPVATPVRTVTVPWSRRVTALGDLVELLDPASLVIWTAERGLHDAIAASAALDGRDTRVVTGDAPEASTVIAFDLPDASRLRQLAGAGEVVLLVPPGSESYVERLTSVRRPLRLPGALEAATTAAAARRAAIVRALEAAPTPPERALFALAPLFERYDPATVAAALYELWTSAAGAAAPTALPDIPATARVYVGVGKKDGATVNDLVAVLTKEVRVERGKIGRVELRDGFSLVEVPAQEAERVATALNGTTIRRRRVTARVDRGGPARPATTRPAGPRRGTRPPDKR